MRALALIPFLLAAACSQEAEAPEKAAAATSLSAGEWHVVTEVTSFTSTDDGAPRIDTPVGTRTEARYCIGADEAARPAPALFAGEEDSCTYERFYMRNGRINSGLACNREGLGQIMRNVTGTFTADSFEAEVDTNTYFTSDGDVRIGTSVTGTRTGDCTPEAAG